MNVHKIVDRCLGQKFDGCLTDFDPLVAVMEMVVEIIGEKRLRENPKARRMWVRVLEILQKGGELEHNKLIPCRFCDTAFEPLVDEQLLDLCLTWLESYETSDLLAIHRCPSCGGTLKILNSTKYEGDGFTPIPGTIDNDDEWSHRLRYGDDILEDES